MTMTVMSHTKVCFKCGIEKSITDFSKHKGMKDGYLGKCKECAITYSKKHRKDNPTYYKRFEEGRKDDVTRKEKKKEYAIKYNKAEPEKRKARSKINNAIRDGRLVKESCCWCGDEHSEAHHIDYSKPFDIIWLCSKHHSHVHNGDIKIYGDT